MRRETFATGTPWEPIVGYSRTVRVGPFVSVSRTTATSADGRLVGAGDSGGEGGDSGQCVARVPPEVEARLQELMPVVRRVTAGGPLFAADESTSSVD